MNIDEKLRRNWYLEQDEINTLIKRYRIMKYVIAILSVVVVVLIAGCGVTGSDSDNCYEEELLRIIQYEGDRTYQFETYYLHPDKEYDVQQGKEYIYCIDDERNIKSIEPVR